jgi:hypothetical protein
MTVIRPRPRGPLRSRLTYRGAAAAASIVAVAALAACASSSPGGSAAAGSGSAAASGASGTLNWEWELPTSWDPVTSSAGWDMHALGLVYASVTTPESRR